jgi:hypothetical protein
MHQPDVATLPGRSRIPALEAMLPPSDDQLGHLSQAELDARVSLKRLLDGSPWLHFTSECQRF